MSLALIGENNEFKIRLNSEEVKKCDEIGKSRAKYYKWKSSDISKDKYIKGVINSKKDYYKAERIGAYGEYAFSSLFNIPIDKNIYEGGDDGYDFILSDKKIDIKTFTKKYENIRNKDYQLFVKATNYVGENVHLKSDIYVFCYLEKETTEEVIILFDGYIDKAYLNMIADKRLEDALVKKGKKTWKNIYIKKTELLKLSDLIWENRLELDK